MLSERARDDALGDKPTRANSACHYRTFEIVGVGAPKVIKVGNAQGEVTVKQRVVIIQLKILQIVVFKITLNIVYIGCTTYNQGKVVKGKNG